MPKRNRHGGTGLVVVMLALGDQRTNRELLGGGLDVVAVRGTGYRAGRTHTKKDAENAENAILEVLRPLITAMPCYHLFVPTYPCVRP